MPARTCIIELNVWHDCCGRGPQLRQAGPLQRGAPAQGLLERPWRQRTATAAVRCSGTAAAVPVQPAVEQRKAQQEDQRV